MARHLAEYLAYTALLVGAGFLAWRVYSQVAQAGMELQLTYILLASTAVFWGVAAFFNPCSLPVLPAYVSRVVSESGGREVGLRAIWVPAVLGLVAFNSMLALAVLVALRVLGEAGSLFSASEAYIRALRASLGVALAYIAITGLVGRPIVAGGLVRLGARLGRAARERELPLRARMFSYGFFYTLLGVGCTGPILAGLLVVSLSAGATASLIAFTSFTATMAVLMAIHTGAPGRLARIAGMAARGFPSMIKAAYGLQLAAAAVIVATALDPGVASIWS